MDSPLPTKTLAEPITININEAVRLSGLSRSTIYKLIGEGQLETRLVRNRRLVSMASLRNLVEGSTAQ
jgi:predicted DNA-binding transcriptional regulator AlpA